jgi:hypothetical protein
MHTRGDPPEEAGFDAAAWALPARVGLLTTHHSGRWRGANAVPAPPPVTRPSGLARLATVSRAMPAVAVAVALLSASANACSSRPNAPLVRRAALHYAAVEDARERDRLKHVQEHDDVSAAATDNVRTDSFMPTSVTGYSFACRGRVAAAGEPPCPAPSADGLRHGRPLRASRAARPALRPAGGFRRAPWHL